LVVLSGRVVQGGLTLTGGSTLRSEGRVRLLFIRK